VWLPTEEEKREEIEERDQTPPPPQMSAVQLHYLQALERSLGENWVPYVPSGEDHPEVDQ
jgi:hypothetical protein